MQKQGLNKVTQNVCIYIYNFEMVQKKVSHQQNERSLPTGDVSWCKLWMSFAWLMCFHWLSGDQPPGKMAQETNKARSCLVPRHVSALQKHLNVYA